MTYGLAAIQTNKQTNKQTNYLKVAHLGKGTPKSPANHANETGLQMSVLEMVHELLVSLEQHPAASIAPTTKQAFKLERILEIENGLLHMSLVSRNSLNVDQLTTVKAYMAMCVTFPHNHNVTDGGKGHINHSYLKIVWDLLHKNLSRIY
jgi:hypothetical protein